MLTPLLYTVDPERYPRYLEEKTAAALAWLRRVDPQLPAPEIFPSPPQFYRMRAEFAGRADAGGGWQYLMTEPHTRHRVAIPGFPPAAAAINAVMRRWAVTAPRWPELRRRLFATDFLANRAGDTVLTFNYHRELDPAVWSAAAAAWRAEARAAGISVDLVGRARRQKLTVTRDHVVETLPLDDGGSRALTQVEGSFSQPNYACCVRMVNFARQCLRGSGTEDLLELYCGSGTFTVCLADRFRRVLATEVARDGIQTAAANLAANGIANVTLVRLSAAEAAAALRGERAFRRCRSAGFEPSGWRLRTLLVDPPRTGLAQPAARTFAAAFPRVLYFSCQPASLAADLQELTRTHRATRLAFFDQFPYTPHLESAVLLCRRQ